MVRTDSTISSWSPSLTFLPSDLLRFLSSPVENTLATRTSRTPVGEEGPAFKLVCKAGPERSSPGRRMPDGQTRQRLRTAVLELEQDSNHGDSHFCVVSCGSWLLYSPRFRPRAQPEAGPHQSVKSCGLPQSFQGRCPGCTSSWISAVLRPLGRRSVGRSFPAWILNNR